VPQFVVEVPGKPACDASFAGGTGRFPAISGLKVAFHCASGNAVIESMAKTPSGAAGPSTPILPGDSVRIATVDFLYGGDGYTVFRSGTNVLQTGDLLLDLAIEYVRVNSPISAAVEGRIVKH
jgi:hypothetical protein